MATGVWTTGTVGAAAPHSLFIYVQAGANLMTALLRCARHERCCNERPRGASQDPSDATPPRAALVSAAPG